MGRRKTVSNTAGSPSDPAPAHIPTPGATHPSPQLGDTPSPTPEEVSALSAFLEGGDASSQEGSPRQAPTSAAPALGDADTAGPPDTPASTPRIPAIEKAKGRAPPARSLSPIHEADRSMNLDGAISPHHARSPSPPPRLPPTPPGLVHPAPGPSRPVEPPRSATYGNIPQVLGKRPNPVSVPDEDGTLDRIVLTAAELQALLQAHAQRLQPTTVVITPSALPAVGTGGTVVYEGGLGPGTRSHKRVRHYLPREDQVYSAIDPSATVVPMKIILALEAGMPQFIPLSLLTAKACRDALRTSSLDRSAKHALQLEGNAITVKAAAFDASKESSLTPLDWLDASSRFVGLIRQHLTVGDNAEPGGPDAAAMAAMWDSHFRRIQNRPNFAERFCNGATM
ncbi:hypothetical protein F5887DRAFT_1076945 [Amanita rubescens]|nr:hypothetical protein F5887DRAFT_1076945 [Amanita rubescens]